MKGTVLGFYSMLLGCAATYGQQDITSIYLANPSFEEDATACTQDSPEVVYVKTEATTEELRGWDINPKGWVTTNPSVSLLINRDCFTDNNFGKRKQPTENLPTTNVSVGAVQIRKCGKPHPHPCRPENTN